MEGRVERVAAALDYDEEFIEACVERCLEDEGFYKILSQSVNVNREPQEDPSTL